MTDQNGTVARRHDYFPFGDGSDGTTAGQDPLRFTGQERDAESGLDHFGARQYMSRPGRFTTADPGHVGGNIFDPQSWNAYAYARNNPLRFIDPTGTDYEINWLNDGSWSRSYVGEAGWERALSDLGWGYQLSGNNILAFVDSRWVLAGYFSHVGPDRPHTFTSMIETAGNAAAEKLTEHASEMARNAVVAVGIGGLRWGLEAAVAAVERKAALALLRAAQENWKRIPMEQRRAAMDWLSKIKHGAPPPGPLPPGVNIDALSAYRELALRVIRTGNDTVGTQRLRVEAINRAIGK